MTLFIGIDPTTPFHFAVTPGGKLCAFTANRLGYRTLLKWTRDLAQGEPLLFLLPSFAGYGRLVADWLAGQGERVALAPVRVVR